MNRRLSYYVVPLLASLLVMLAARGAGGQPSPQGFIFRPGQAMYIVAYRKTYPFTTTNPDGSAGAPTGPDYLDYDLDAERKVRKRIEDWTPFRVVDKPSEADFVFLVNLNNSSIEGLAVPADAYRQHFKEKYDLDGLREAAYGRYLVGPLKLATTSRLADRLVKQFQEKVAVGTGKKSK